MMQRRRKCCLLLLLAVVVCSVCSVIFSPTSVHSAIVNYRSQMDGDTRRLLQDQAPAAAPDGNAAKVAKEVKISEKDKFRVPIFWDDGEFMDEDEEVVAEGIEAARGNRRRALSGQNETIIGQNVQKEETENDRTMSVLDYKLSQFQTVTYSNDTMTGKGGPSDEKAGGGKESTSRVLPVHLLIVTQRRSGSSFLGQIFNQNPWVFFHFEPLKLLEIKKNVYKNASVLLQNIFKCRFDKTPYLMDLYNNETLHRLSSKVLCSPPLCRLNMDFNMLKTPMVKRCPLLKEESVTNVCNVYPHKVVKLIRLYNIETLGSLLRDKELNVKIVHLLRDPRGTLLSRAKEHPSSAKALSLGTSLDHDAAYICRRMRQNFRFVRQNKDLLKNRYMRVRYEDIAAHPERWTRALYKFAGMGDVPLDVFKWIQQNTQASSVKDVQDTYSTHRNSSATAQAWRHSIDFPVVQAIQSFCDDVLNEAGYVHVKQAKDLGRKDLSLVAQVT
ncbi:carbohydrate sulfotransferase 1-like [Diadema setosum]|uniref:carbohydrate sulfotransferase 1-like n=1 Tax=Diadema setosum TaxID=31175 RepID=UPI003B3BC346